MKDEIDIELVEIFEVDFVQTDISGEERGTMYVNLSIEDDEFTHIYRNFPLSVYDEWHSSDFDPHIYFSEIEPNFNYAEEHNDDEDDEDDEE